MNVQFGSDRIRMLNRVFAVAAPIIAGIIFLGIFWQGYHTLPEHLWKDRDDGIITMSHARNLVEYGFVGVNPSGERVEGYSTPLQFLTYLLLYFFTRLDYSALALIQTVLTTFFLGFIFHRFFAARPVIGLFCTVIAALFLRYSYSFFEWHGSGMENALTHVFFLFSVLLLGRAVERGNFSYWIALPVFFAAISRIELIYPVAALLFLFTVVHYFVHRTKRGLILTGIVLSLWLLLMAIRYLYFGAIFPNTAAAQGISVGGRLSLLVALSPDVWKDSFRLVGHIVFTQHIYAALFALAALLVARRDASLYFVFGAFVLLLAMFALHPFLFGEPRLDPSRSTTPMALFAVAAALVPFARVRSAREFILPFVLAIVCLSVYLYKEKPTPYEICCKPKNFEAVRKDFLREAQKYDIPRPTVAIPDLGVVSWYKEFNVVDFGLLGSTMMTALHGYPPLLAEYFFEYAAPDVIENHCAWSCRVHYLFSDPRFAQQYAPVHQNVCDSCSNLAYSGIWVRRDAQKGSDSAERRMIEALRRSPDSAVVRRELEDCLTTDPSGVSCRYVVRTVYRFLPELRAKYGDDELTALFEKTPFRDYAVALIESRHDARWHERAIGILHEANEPLEKSDIVARSYFTIYRRGNMLYYHRPSCSPQDTAAQFFLHVEPENDPRRRSFINCDFKFAERRLSPLDPCTAAVSLPDVTVRKLRTGQYVGNKALWKIEFALPPQKAAEAPDVAQ